MSNVIKSILTDSIADELGIEAKDSLLKINGKNVRDIIDYYYLISDEYIEVEIKKNSGEIWILEIDKDYDEELGLVFENPILDDAKSCTNKCVFCFIDQLPQGMRSTLYFKDDDSRLSFLQGNFVTLTNVSDEILNRIIEYNISPINVSIHTTNPELRVKMLGNRFAGEIMNKLEILSKGNIEMNGQVVLCPDLNDGKELERTVEDLVKFYPNLHSVAVVPVGITKFRDGLFDMKLFDVERSRETIKLVNRLQDRLLHEIGTRFVFLSDEFYISGETELPEFEEYEGFVQIENGVGLIRSFENQVLTYISENKNRFKNISKKTVTLASGLSAYNFMDELSKKMTDVFPEIKFNVYGIENKYFGETITVTGLLTGSDLLSELSGKELGDMILLPEVMFKSGEDIFLDDMSILDLEAKLGVKIIKACVNGKDFVEKILTS